MIKRYRLIIVALLLLSAIFSAFMIIDDLAVRSNTLELPNITEQPFLISLNNLEIVQENKRRFIDGKLTTVDGQSRRLLIEVSILNTTKNDYENVSYTLTLNNESKPFIASMIISITSDQFKVVSEEKAVELRDRYPRIVTGFINKWGMLLTQEYDLENHRGKRPEQLEKYVRYITVTVNWNSGQQSKIIPLDL